MKDPSDLPFALPPDVLAAQFRKRKQPLQDRSRASVEAICEATLQVLLESGAAALNTTRVAERAGVSVGTLYQYFPDKQSLLMAIKTQYITRVMGAIHALICSQIGQPIESAVATIVRDVLRIKAENIRVTSVVRAALTTQADDGAMRAASQQLCEAMTALLLAARPDLADARMKATVLVSALDGAINAAVGESPAVLSDAAFEGALVALALGFARTL